MKRFVVISLSLIFLFLFSFPSFAETYSVYGSVTESTSQIAFLLGVMKNDPDFRYSDDYTSFRSSQYQYVIFFGDLDDQPYFYTYDQISSGYNSYWSLSSRHQLNSGLSISNPDGYTIVGSKPGMSLSNNVYQYRFQFVFTCLAFGFFALWLFNTFRPRYTTDRKGMKL